MKVHDKLKNTWFLCFLLEAIVLIPIGIAGSDDVSDIVGGAGKSSSDDEFPLDIGPLLTDNFHSAMIVKLFQIRYFTC